MSDFNILIENLRNKNVLEFGGPTELFYTSLDCYNIFKELTIVNSSNYTEFENSKKIVNCKNSYNFDFTNETNLSNINILFDAIISSHVIEHIANPIKFIQNAKTKLNTNGFILSILPNKDCCWDHIREHTTYEHILNDYISNIQEDDLTHLHENLKTNHPWKSKPNYLDIFTNNFDNRGLHHHCFNPEVTKKMHEYCGFKTLYCNYLSNDLLQLVYFGIRII